MATLKQRVRQGNIQKFMEEQKQKEKEKQTIKGVFFDEQSQSYPLLPDDSKSREPLNNSLYPDPSVIIPHPEPLW